MSRDILIQLARSLSKTATRFRMETPSMIVEISSNSSWVEVEGQFSAFTTPHELADHMAERGLL